MNIRFFYFMQVQIQNGDLHQVGIGVESREGTLFEGYPLRGRKIISRFFWRKERRFFLNLMVVSVVNKGLRLNGLTKDPSYLIKLQL